MQLHGIVTDLQTDPEQEWNDLRAVAVEHWETALSPPDMTATVQQRIEVMLAEMGWERAPGATSANMLVRRRAASFRCQRLGEQIAVLTQDTGELVDLCPLDPAKDVSSALERCGWQLGSPLSGWTQGAWEVQPQDWITVLARVQQARDRLRAEAAARERGWRELIRLALMSGVRTPVLTRLTGLTRQRLYQIRDRRR